MGLGSSLTTALTGLKASQQSIAVLSQNIANANNTKYSRQVVAQSAVPGNDIAGSGVKIDEVNRVVDEFVNRTVVSRNSIVAQAETISNYYNQAQVLFGQPGQSNSIDTYTQKFFQSLSTLSVTPELSRADAVNSAERLAGQVSDLARGIEELRFQVDGEIGQSVDRINNSINKISTLNKAIVNATSLGQSINTISDEVDAALFDLSSELNIQYSFDEFGKVSITTGSGIQLVGDGSTYNLSYEPAGGVQNFIDDDPSLAIKVSRLNADGSQSSNSTIILVSAGSKSEIESKLSGGNLQALVELRDKLLPDILDQLDNFMATVRDSVNAIYNNGSGYPPPASLTGTTLIDPAETNNWQGTVTIAALQANGKPVASPYASQTSQGNGFKPLTLDLSALSDQNLANGTVKFQSIIDEINNYYGIPQNAVTIGALANVELVSKSDSLTAGTGNFNFALETTNLSANNRNFTITSIATSDPNITVSAPAAFPTSAYTAEAGKTESTNTDFTLNMSSGLIGAGPYSITVGISVADGLGGFLTDTITYTIPQASDGFINDRFAPASVGVGDATLETATSSTQAILRAKLVDASGNEVSKNAVGEYTDSGYLVIEGVNGNRVAIAEETSEHLGTNLSNATGYGFSHFFGLNNFFETGDGTNPSATADAAITMRVRADISKTPGLFSSAQLILSSQPDAVDSNPRYTFEVSSGNNSAILALANLSTTPVSFSAAGGLPELNVSFNNYASQILGYNASVASEASENFRTEDLIAQGFKEKKDSVSGVNLDEEIANTVIYQNAYSANARVISVIGEMFDALLAAF